MKLVIFDLDQTLVNVFSAHDKAFHKTMEEIFGIKACYKDIDYVGKRVPDLIREYALKEGVTPQVAAMNIDEAERVYELNFAMAVRDVKKHVLPGVKKLLEALSKKHKLALVTGDPRSIAETVLERGGLAKYFPVIVTADDAPTRKDMVKRAIKKAGSASSRSALAGARAGKFSEVWVVGDSTRDIDAGKANNAKTIGVLTGEHDKKTLAAHQPAYIFKDLSPTKKIVEAIG